MTYIVIDPPNQVPEEDIQFERRTFVWWRGAKKSYRCSEVSGPDLRTRIALSGGHISKFGKELQALRITIIATIGPIWTENYDILSFFVNEA